jgi:hypothetical protein
LPDKGSRAKTSTSQKGRVRELMVGRAEMRSMMRATTLQSAMPVKLRSDLTTRTRFVRAVRGQ